MNRSSLAAGRPTSSIRLRGIPRRSRESSPPMPIRRDPLGSLRRRRRQRQIQNRDLLAFGAPFTYRDNLVRIGHINPFDRDLRAQNLRREGRRQVVLHHRVKPNRLFGIAVGIGGGFLNQLIQPHPAEPRRSATRTAHVHPRFPWYPGFSTLTSPISPLAYRARSTFLSSFPTLVLGTSSINAQRSGNHQRATRAARKSRSCSIVADAPGFITTHASGRSSQRSSGTPITTASSTSGCAIRWFSSSIEEIHSPPDLITSLARSVIWMNPFASTTPTSPVRSQPSWNFSGQSSR